ncbi:MAG: tRNA glutamyl-Q(34) synthetase GluQRS [Acidobacteria bacterium]|nr:tRNA glutamyl-Q(34) synthetase GluQRS [Acidobacteriota bacterium]
MRLRLPAAPLSGVAPNERWITRYAPAPTGRLHLGHVVNALWVWGLARAFGGRVLLRIEDHDRTRCRPEYERALLDDLDWLGLEPAPDPGSGAPRVRQSDREALYREALDRLAAAGDVYVCACSRREILERSGARRGEEPRYPGTCAALGLPESAAPMRRVRFERREVEFDDALLGARRQVPAEQCGDLLARDRDDQWTYQFAVTVDDLVQGVDVVVRGEDLLESTGRQIQLAERLGRATPARFLHHPLVYRADGAKLSKATGDTAIAELRSAGWSAERVLGAAAAAIGWLEVERPLPLAEVVEGWAEGSARRSGAP